MSPTLADFEGGWILRREIEDRLSGRPGQFEGRAVLRWDGPVLRYDETGVLRLAGQAPLTARQSYLWRADGAAIAVDFADGRPFHRFDPGQAQPEARHCCAPDDYRVRYDFSAWPVWSAIWDVQGPRKHYRSHSRFRHP